MNEEKTASRMEISGCSREKIEKAVEGCISAMSNLSIKESKIARMYLGSAMDGMYKRNPDTVIGTIRFSQPD